MSTTAEKNGFLHAPTPRLPPASLTLNTAYLHHEHRVSPSPSSSPSPITGSSSTSATVDYRRYNTPSPVGLYSNSGNNSRISLSPSPLNLYTPQHAYSYNPSPAISRSHTPVPSIAMTINESSTHTTDAVRRYGGEGLPSSTIIESASLHSEKSLSSQSIVSMATRVLTRIVPPFRPPTSSRNAPRLRIDKGHRRRHGHKRQYSISSRGSLYGYGVPDAVMMLVFIIACLFFVAALCGFGAADDLEVVRENAEHAVNGLGGKMKRGIKEESYAYMHVDPDGYVSHHSPNAYASVNRKEQRQMFFTSVIDNNEVTSDTSLGQVDEKQVYFTTTDESYTPSDSDSKIMDGRGNDYPVPLAAGEDAIPDPTPAPVTLSPLRNEFYDRLWRNVHRKFVTTTA